MAQVELEVTVDTTKAGSASDTFVLPAIGGTFDVDWGDTNTDVGVSGQQTHVYTVGGTYTIKITSTGAAFQPFKFNNLGDKLKLITIVDWGTSCEWDSCDVAFNGCANLASIGTGSVPDFGTSTSMLGMLTICTSLTTVDMTGWDTSSVTTMAFMFQNSTALTSITGLGGLDVSAVTTMFNMFSGASKITSIDTTGWTATVLTITTSMFSGCALLTTLNFTGLSAAPLTTTINMLGNCTVLTTLTGEQNLDMSSVTTTDRMFSGCKALVTINLTGWALGVAWINADSMFQDCRLLTTLTDHASLDTQSVTTMKEIFRDCRAITNIDVSSWTTSNVAIYRSMFENTDALVSITGIEDLDVSAATDFAFMFSDASALAGVLDLSSWNTSLVGGGLDNTFEMCSSLTSINMTGWDTSSIVSFGNAFNNCALLTEVIGLSNVDVTSVTNMSNMFLNTTLDIENYSTILKGFEAQSVQSSVSFHGGNSLYYSGGPTATARANLISDHSWTIIDGGEGIAEPISAIIGGGGRPSFRLDFLRQTRYNRGILRSTRS